MDGAQAVTAELQVVGHGACTGVAEIKGRFPVEWGPRITVGNVHLRECQAVEYTPASISHLQPTMSMILLSKVKSHLHRRAPYPPSG